MEPSERESLHDLRSASELNHRVYDTYVRGNYDRLVAKSGTQVTFSVEEIYDLMGWVSMRNIVSDLRPTEGRLDNQSLVTRLDFSQILDFYGLMIALNILIPTDDSAYQYVHIALRDHSASNYAFALIHDQDVSSRLNAVYVFEKTRDRRSIPHLIECLRDDYARVRGTAAQLLGDIGDWRATAGLIALTGDGDKVIKKIALDAISNTTDPKATETLIIALSHDNPAVQQVAITALMNIGHPAIDRLIEALKHEKALIRGQAALILGTVGDSSVIPSLKMLLNDHDSVTFGQSVSDLAAEAIDKLNQLH